jgi:hypothetical protein
LIPGSFSYLYSVIQAEFQNHFYALKKYLLILFSAFLFLSKSNPAFASHIAGGEITVTYTGRDGTNTGGLFTVSMNYFRDCSGIAYPGTVTVNIYNSTTNALQQSVVLNPSAPVTLSLGDGCYVPTLCLQQRLYSAVNVDIPDNAGGYYLVYEECCRNGATVNIVSPSSVNYVFYSRIPNPAMGNSSPYFSAIPDGYMCQGYVNTDKFTATDPNGDSLVYSLVDPTALTSTGASGPLPFTPVTWVAGYYTTNPMGDPGMVVSPTTGTMNTLPTTTGIFILAVKVEEYRNNVKIGEITREFQYQVTNCALLSISVNPGNPICLGTTCTVVATGSNVAGTTYLWSSGQTTSSIIVTPASAGTYNYSVTATYWNTSVTPNAWCIQSTNANLVVNQNPTVTVTNTGNICAGQNQTLTASGGIAYSWSNGSPIADLSVSPGTYTVWVTNSYNCSKTGVGTISPPVASSYTWTGTGLTGADNWFDSNNWGNSSGCLPNCLTDVFIPNTPAAATNNPPDIGIGYGPASCKDITLYQGNKIIFSSTNSELDVCGDFMDNGVIQNTGGNTGILKFQGAITQNFIRSSTASGNPFYKVILANTATPLPILTIKDAAGNKDMPISSFGDFTFTSGVLVTEGDRKLIINNTASNAISGHGPTRYVCGRIKRNLTAATSYDFPVGNMPVFGNAYPYQLMNVYFSSLGTLTDISVSFENPTFTNAVGVGLPVNETTMPGQYTALLDNGGTNTGLGYTGSIGGLWTIIPNDYTAAATYSMTLQGRNYDNSGTFEHTILKRNTFCPGTWSVDGTYNSSSKVGNVVTASRTGMAGFSQVVLAKTTFPLPVVLVLFDASCDKEHTVLSWVTASEQNNDYFTIERSCDENSSQYQAIATIPGAGNSSTMRTYSFTDNDETPGNCYYRLSQTDYNGVTTEFAPIQINCRENAAFNFIGVLPNPAQDVVNVLFTSVNEDQVTMRLTDMMGKEILTRSIQPQIGLNKIEIPFTDFSSGVYFMSVSNGKKSFVKKIVKKD